MATKWKSVNTNDFIPSELLSVGDVIGTVSDSLTTALGIVETALGVAQSLASAASVNPIEAALRALIDELLSIIDQITEDAGVHGIMIPIQKQYYGAAGTIPRTQEDPFSLTPNFDQLVNDNAFAEQVIADITPESITFINNSNNATGGNAGFWKELIFSTRDEGDLARPNFPNNFAVTGVCLVAGASNLTNINSAIAALELLLNMGPRADPAARSRPKVEEFTAKTVPILGENRIGVQLDWAPVPTRIVKPLFSGANFEILEIFVIRSTSPKIRERFNWNTNFKAQPGNSDLPSQGNTKVVARLANDGFLRTYVDTDTSLEENTPYYYALSLRYSIDDVVQPMSPLSAVRRVFYTRRPLSTRQSEAPDWWATPSLIQLFPIIEDYIGQARLFIASLLSRTSSNSGLANILQQIINQITNITDYINEINDELTNLTELLQALSNANGQSLSSTKISVTTGGMNAWAGELARRMSDPTDASRPPYDNGELVTGVVIVAGAPNITQLAAVDRLLTLFFGDSGGENAATAQVTNRVIDALGDPPPSLGAVSAGLNNAFDESSAPITGSGGASGTGVGNDDTGTTGQTTATGASSDNNTTASGTRAVGTGTTGRGLTPREDATAVGFTDDFTPTTLPNTGSVPGTQGAGSTQSADTSTRQSDGSTNPIVFGEDMAPTDVLDDC